MQISSFTVDEIKSATKKFYEDLVAKISLTCMEVALTGETTVVYGCKVENKNVLVKYLKLANFSAKAVGSDVFVTWFDDDEVDDDESDESDEDDESDEENEVDKEEEEEINGYNTGWNAGLDAGYKYFEQFAYEEEFTAEYGSNFIREYMKDFADSSAVDPSASFMKGLTEGLTEGFNCGAVNKRSPW